MCRHHAPDSSCQAKEGDAESSSAAGDASRRTVLRSMATLVAAGGLAVMVPARLVRAETVGDAAGTVTRSYTGRSPFGYDQWAYVPFDVPAGVRRISVTYTYDRFTAVPGVASNVLDIGVFGPAGWDVGDEEGFRGWSGGARDSFTISASDATPGYLPGPIEPGTWAIALGPIVVDAKGMGWQVNVTLEHGDPGAPFVASPAPTSARGRGSAWYRGDMHLHTVYSDGRRTPEQLVAAARAAGLDFIASTEHNTRSANQIWGRYAPDDLLIISGEEVTTRHGHWLAVGLAPGRWIDWRYGPRQKTFEAYATDVRRSGGLVIAAHPAIPLPGTAWEFGYDHVDAVEVWNGPWTLDDHLAVQIWDGLLRKGGRQVAVGNSDAHHGGHVVGLPQTVAYADELSTEAVIEAVRRGRSYLAESAQVTLDLVARVAESSAGQRTAGQRTAGPGRTLRTHGARAAVTASVTGVPLSLISLHTDRGQVAAVVVPASGTGSVTWHGRAAQARFVRAEVRHLQATGSGIGSMAALSNPVWLA